MGDPSYAFALRGHSARGVISPCLSNVFLHHVLDEWFETEVKPRLRGECILQAIALSIDGGHVRSVRSYQVRSFEVMLGQVSNDDGKQFVFSSMPAEADRQREQLRGVLHGLGATPVTPVTILSDGARRTAVTR